ncbi:hypothetical protein FB451DRAFT_1208056 [Mycena latifolia]|nr:hypothetical protein FB451DRAFT_1208056 [Mycena latifolia]
MLDHYYTPRDAPDPRPHPHSLMAMGIPSDFEMEMDMQAQDPKAPRAPAVVDLRTLDLEHLAFDCDSGSESGSDDGYVSTLQRIQRALPPPPPPPRKIAGARRVARAVSSPQAVRVMDIEVQGKATATTAGVGTGRSTPEGEVFQSITAIPGLESTSFEELRLETYLQSLIATGTARPQPAFVPALVIPPAFSPPFCEWDKDAGEADVDMTPVPAIHPPPQPVFRAASYPPAHQWP